METLSTRLLTNLPENVPKVRGVIGIKCARQNILNMAQASISSVMDKPILCLAASDGTWLWTAI